MLDIKFIRENKEAVAKAAKDKNISLDIEELLKLDEKRRLLVGSLGDLRANKNSLAGAVQNSKPSPETIEQGKMLKTKITEQEKELDLVEEKYFQLMVQVPTIPSADTPIAPNEIGNKEIYVSGKIPKFSFKPKNHIELAKDLDLIDFERGVKTSGYRGYYLKNEASQIVLAMMLYAMNKMVSKGYTPMIPPTLVKGFSLFGTGYFKGKEYNPEIDEIYQIANSDKESDGTVSKENKFLVGTSEPSLLAYYADEVLKGEDLPIKLCGFSQCYRSEIGGYGKDTKGLYRVHEFFKVEQIVIAPADAKLATKLQDEMLEISKEIHEELGLVYRILQICTGDMSAGKYRALDIETWLPGSEKWAETGSASSFLDWQSRRLNIKYTDKEGNKQFAYLLNNTALPSPRPLIAIMENYQTKDGSIEIPKVLRPYLPFKKISR